MPKQDFSDRYNTQLSDKEEAKFRDFMASYQLEKEARHQTELNDPSFKDTRSLSQFIHDETNDYDMRGAFKASLKQDGRLHWDDEFKKPNHETFSTGSKYHGVDGYKGGIWKDGNYTVGPTTRAMYSDEELEKYRQEVEPNAQFIFDPSVHKNGYTGKEDLPLNSDSALNGLAKFLGVKAIQDGLANYYGQKPHTYVLGGGSGLVDLSNNRFTETLPDGTTASYYGISPEDIVAAQVDVRNNVNRDRSLILDAAQQTSRVLTNGVSNYSPVEFNISTPTSSGPRG